MAERIQLSRRKGWRKPAGAVVVSRPSKWGNPWRVGGAHGRHRGDCVKYFRAWVEDTEPGRLLAEAARRELRGKDLACWCPLPKPGEPDQCHAAVLLEIANAGKAVPHAR